MNSEQLEVTLRDAIDLIKRNPKVRLLSIGVAENGLGETVVDYAETEWEGTLSDFLEENTLELAEIHSLILNNYTYFGGGAQMFSKLEVVE